MKALLFVNHRRINSADMRRIENELRERDIEMLISVGKGPGEEQGADVLMTFGGDGTVLKAVKIALAKSIPVLSFRAGSVGFLTSFDLEHLSEALDLLVSGKLVSDSRKLLTIKMRRQTIFALNDCVIERGAPSRTVSFLVDSEGFDSYHIAGDGVVLSTSTGSTAYSLAAGGPVIDPEANVYCVTPISPHNPFVGSLVVSAERATRVEVVSDKGFPTTVYIDGEESGSLNSGESLTVILSGRHISLLREGPFDYVEVLRRKLAFGGRLRDGF